MRIKLNEYNIQDMTTEAPDPHRNAWSMWSAWNLTKEIPGTYVHIIVDICKGD